MTIHLAEIIYRLNLAQDNHLQKQFKSLDITLIQARLLHTISQQPEIILKELADYLGKPPATLTNIIKQLELKKLIYRSVAKDKQLAKQLKLTAKGQELARQVEAIFQQINHISPKVFRQELDSKLAELLTELLEYYKNK